MSLKEKIQIDLTEALRSKEEIKLLVLRQLSSVIVNKEKEKRYKLNKEGISGNELEKQSRLSEDEIMQVIFQEAKKRKESIVEFEKGKREDLVAKEKKELVVIGLYLPEQLSRDEIEVMVKEVIAELGASSIKDMGRVMGVLATKTKGKADGATMGSIVKGLLS